MKIVFMGTPEFAAVALDALIASPHEVALVITQPDKEKNRGKKVMPTPVKEVALQAGLQVIQTERIRSDEEAMAVLRETAPDIIVVAAYGQILPKEILELPRYGCVNIHASLLPRYRGAAPIQRAIIDGEARTGITIMQMAEGLDTGDMLLSAATDIGRKTYTELHDELAKMGAELILEVLDKLEAGALTPVKQDDSLSTYAKMLFKSDGELIWENEATVLERLVRGFPGAYTYLDGEIFKVWASETADGKKDAAPGTVLRADKTGLLIAAGGGTGLLLTEVQAAGKKRMNAGDYLRGKSVPEGICLRK